MRFGQNALTTINNVKAKLAEVQKGLPPGVVVRPVYDRSDLIERAIETLREQAASRSRIIVALVCVVFLLHASSALVAILTLPIGILMAFIAHALRSAWAPTSCRSAASPSRSAR